MTASEQPAAPVCTATGCSHPAAVGAQLCALDVRRLGDWLAQLGTEYELLSAVPSMQGREVGTIGGTALASQRSPGVTQVMALRSRYRGTGRIGWEDADAWGLDDTPSVYSTLASYAEQVREQRKITPPRMDVAHVRTARPAGPVCDPEQPRCGHHTCEVWTFRANVAAPLTVASERRLLAVHLAWILGQEWAGEFFDDIQALWSALRSANGQGGGGPEGICIDCDGPVSWQAGAATCSRCGVTAKGLDVVRRHSVPAGERMSA